jgi:uncharacterized membrane protein YidH (DUF202 family)
VRTAEISRRLTLSIRQAVAGFLAVVGLITVAVGLLYVVADRALPRMVQGHAHGGHHAKRAAVCLVIGGACLAAAWLLRGRRRPA